MESRTANVQGTSKSSIRSCKWCQTETGIKGFTDICNTFKKYISENAFRRETRFVKNVTNF